MTIIVIAGFLHDTFEHKTTFITNIHTRSFNDTIENVFTEKAAGVITKITGCDTCLIIDGINDSLHLWFSSYADLGFKEWEDSNISILLKIANSDSFYILRDNKKIGFRIAHP
jgi:hypothetical protein